MSASITIRAAMPEDRVAIEELAQLDESRVPAGELMLAFVGGELQAARSVSEGTAVSHPFRRTRDLLELLETHAGRTPSRPWVVAPLLRWRHAA